MATSSRVRGWFEGYFAGLALSLPFIPTLAAIFSVVSYLLLPAAESVEATPMLQQAPGAPAVAVAVGLVLAAASWLALGLLARPLTSAEKAQPRLHAELGIRLEALTDRLNSVKAAPRGAPPSALPEVRDLLLQASSELSPPRSGPAFRWVLGRGYTNIMRLLHRAGEILILLEPKVEVIRVALDDDLSLADSSIGERDRLRATLRASIERLSAGAAKAYLPTIAGASSQDLTEMEAREGAREVDHALEKFRDDRRDDLVSARFNLVCSTLAVALPAYLLLGLSMIVGVPRVLVVAASVYFLVGAIVGLFQQLDSQARSNTATDDFGLFQARLVAKPLQSGVAAVAGVALVTLVTGLASGAETSALAGDLARAFDLAVAPVNMLYAAIFGLTPALLTTNLDKRGDKLLAELTSSAPAAGAAP
jgi:hypothetical protein